MEILLYALGIVIFAVALAVSIAMHELGHLLVAKKFGCRVSEYMVGFGKTVFSFTPTIKGGRSETTYGLKLIPFGGYVRIIGMYPPEVPRKKRFTVIEEVQAVDPASIDTASRSSLELAGAQCHQQSSKPRRAGMFAGMIAQSRASDHALLIEGDEGREFYRLSWWRKVLIMAAGPAMNLAIAFFCFWGLFGIYGVHTVDATGSTVIESVSDCVIPDTEAREVCLDADPVAPAALAGFQVGDEVVAANNLRINSWDELSVFIHGHGDQEVQFTVQRAGQEVDLKPVELSVMVRDVSQAGEESQMQAVGFVGLGPVTEVNVSHHGPIYTAQQMGGLVGKSLTALVQLPAKVYNVAAAVVGFEERDNNGPVSVVGGSRLAGEVTSNTELGLEVADKAALLTSVVASFNLFIGIFNLIPLVPLDGGHILGAVYEKLRRFLARAFKRDVPKYVDTAKQIPVSYVVATCFIVLTFVLVVGDLLVPISTGL